MIMMRCDADHQHDGVSDFCAGDKVGPHAGDGPLAGWHEQQ
jgi:hypothetical protein